MNKNINVTEVLDRTSNDKFRKSIKTNTEAYIYNNSIETAKGIVRELANRTLRTNHVMLVAKMQSGKTSVCNSVINILTQTKLDLILGIDKFMFISGMNDCGLKDQTALRLTQQVIGANVDNVYVGKHSKRNLSNNKFFVFKNSDLMGYDGDINNAIIFIDESHYGSNEKNILTKFLLKHEIDWKNTRNLAKRNIYIVSVSATPFDELVSDVIQCKKMIELKTGDDYVGVSEYLKNDLIYEAKKDDIGYDGKIFDYIQDAHQRMRENNNGVGVIFIRTRHFDVIRENNYVYSNFDIHEMYSGGSNIEYDVLNNKIETLIQQNNYNNKVKNLKNSSVVDLPTVEVKPLIVLIKGAFRAGITINQHHKDYVYMIYDYSIKADTTAQALLGRMCGYRDTKKCSITNTYFYLNKKYADMYSEWENDFQNRDAIPCNKMKYEWVENDYVGSSETTFGSRSCGNIEIPLTDEEISNLYVGKNQKKNRVEFMEIELPKILKSRNINIDYDYVGEAVLSGKNNYTLSSQEKRFNDFSVDSLVYQFRPYQIKGFVKDTDRDFLTKDDLGKKAVFVVLDAEIYETSNGLKIEGNKRLLVYYVEVAQRIRVANYKGMYKPHKDTRLPKVLKTNKKKKDNE